MPFNHPDDSVMDKGVVKSINFCIKLYSNVCIHSHIKAAVNEWKLKHRQLQAKNLMLPPAGNR